MYIGILFGNSQTCFLALSGISFLAGSWGFHGISCKSDVNPEKTLYCSTGSTTNMMYNDAKISLVSDLWCHVIRMTANYLTKTTCGVYNVLYGTSSKTYWLECISWNVKNFFFYGGQVNNFCLGSWHVLAGNTETLNVFVLIFCYWKTKNRWIVELKINRVPPIIWYIINWLIRKKKLIKSKIKKKYIQISKIQSIPAVRLGLSRWN